MMSLVGNNLRPDELHNPYSSLWYEDDQCPRDTHNIGDIVSETAMLVMYVTLATGLKQEMFRRLEATFKRK